MSEYSIFSGMEVVREVSADALGRILIVNDDQAGEYEMRVHEVNPEVHRAFGEKIEKAVHKLKSYRGSVIVYRPKHIDRQEKVFMICCENEPDRNIVSMSDIKLDTEEEYNKIHKGFLSSLRDLHEKGIFHQHITSDNTHVERSSDECICVFSDAFGLSYKQISAKVSSIDWLDRRDYWKNLPNISGMTNDSSEARMDRYQMLCVIRDVVKRSEFPGSDEIIKRLDRDLEELKQGGGGIEIPEKATLIIDGKRELILGELTSIISEQMAISNNGRETLVLNITCGVKGVTLNQTHLEIKREDKRKFVAITIDPRECVQHQVNDKILITSQYDEYAIPVVFTVPWLKSQLDVMVEGNRLYDGQEQEIDISQDINAGGTYELKVMVENTGKSAVDVTIDCDSSTELPASQREMLNGIEPGQTKEIKIRLMAGQLPGNKSHSIKVKTSEQEFSFTATYMVVENPDFKILSADDGKKEFIFGEDESGIYVVKLFNPGETGIDIDVNAPEEIQLVNGEIAIRLESHEEYKLAVKLDVSQVGTFSPQLELINRVKKSNREKTVFKYKVMRPRAHPLFVIVDKDERMFSCKQGSSGIGPLQASLKSVGDSPVTVFVETDDDIAVLNGEYNITINPGDTATISIKLNTSTCGSFAKRVRFINTEDTKNTVFWNIKYEVKKTSMAPLLVCAIIFIGLAVFGYEIMQGLTKHDGHKSIQDNTRDIDNSNVDSQKQTTENASTETGSNNCPGDMVYISEGSFTMGSNDYSDEMPERTEKTGSFCINKYEVTNSEYDMYESNHYSYEKSSNDNEPVTRVSWSEANNYCGSKGKRLCTEREWEKACRGPQNGRWTFGDDYNSYTCRLETEDGSVPVGSQSGCTNEYGVYDMTGNAAEWVDATYDRNPGYGNHVHRGGHWGKGWEKSRCSQRGYLTPEREHNDIVGIRCCSEPD